jgi:protein-L-isoaspartate(D-aspartate) O-methyltransferase
MPCPPEPPPGAALARAAQALGVKDRRVLRAVGQIDRERFVPPEVRPRAYEDVALPIGHDQTISQPSLVAAMTEALGLTGGEKILEVGTGSGYQTAILALLTDHVYTIERLPALSLRARAVLDGLGFTNIHFRTGDGSLGWPEEAPFDRILVTAGAPFVPPALFDQLTGGGWMIIPLGPEDNQILTYVRKRGDRPVQRPLMPCRFVPLIPSDS